MDASTKRRGKRPAGGDDSGGGTLTASPHRPPRTAGGAVGGGAGFLSRPHPSRRSAPEAGNLGPKALTKGQRQHQARKSPAADHNASLCRHTAYSHPCTPTIAGRNRIEKQG